jgi:hypothetical protein
MKRSPILQSLGTILLGLFVTVAGAGCGGKKLYPVKGRVVYKDGSSVKLLAGGLVLFHPADPDMPQVGARGKIQEDGSFEVTTPKEGEGILPGRYLVTVTPPAFYPKSPDEPRPSLLDERFLRSDTSGLTLEVNQPIEAYTVTVEKPLE